MKGITVRHPLLTCGALVGLLLSGPLLAACDSTQAQEEFITRAHARPAGYTHTDADGNILQEDEDDWRTAPLYGPKVRVDPAYPNPASSGFVTIPVVVRDFNAVRGGLQLWAYDDGRRLRVLDEIPEATQPGTYIFTFSAGLLGSRGLHRLFVLDGVEEIVSYGDLMIEG